MKDELDDEICSDSEIAALSALSIFYKFRPLINKILAEEFENFKKDNYVSESREDNSNEWST